MRLSSCLLMLILVAPGVAAEVDGRRVLEVFVRDGCPYCAEAKAFLPAFAAARPAIRVVYRSVDREPQARDDLIRVSLAAGVWPPGVPTFVFGERMVVGFDSPETTGPVLAALVDEGTVAVDAIESGWLGTLSVARLGLPLFTLAIGLLDGFNPCAMWLLLFLLSVLVHLRDRRRMVLIAGTFVLVSGLVYYAFLAAWLNLFLAVGMSTAVRVTLGVVALVIGAFGVKDFASGRRGLSLSIPAAARPGIYARVRAVMQANTLAGSLAAVAVLAVAVNFVELLCTAGFPAMYSAVLSRQELGAAAHYAYLGLYIVGYIADDSVMVGLAVAALGSRKLSPAAGRWLKLVSGVAMLALGLVLLLRPQWLL